MMKKKQTTTGQGTPKPMSAEVQPPQHQHTSNIAFVGVGESMEDECILKVAVGEKMALLNVDNIGDPRSGELKKLTPLGEPLIKEAARREFRDAPTTPPAPSRRLRSPSELVGSTASTCSPRA
jgi:hypothetical protein